jgi:hypothetical protein
MKKIKSIILGTAFLLISFAANAQGPILRNCATITVGIDVILVATVEVEVCTVCAGSTCGITYEVL